MHVVTRVHFRSRDKDGCYTIRSAVPENPILHASITAVCLILFPIEVLHCRHMNFRPFWLKTLTDDLHIRTWPVVRRDVPHVQIWTSYVKAFEIIVWHIHTDTTKIIRHAASREVKKPLTITGNDTDTYVYRFRNLAMQIIVKNQITNFPISSWGDFVQISPDVLWEKTKTVRLPRTRWNWCDYNTVYGCDRLTDRTNDSWRVSLYRYISKIKRYFFLLQLADCWA